MTKEKRKKDHEQSYDVTKQTIVLGIAGGIAAFKVIELCKNLRAAGYNMIVVMTKSAKQMIDPKEFEVASGNIVYYELFEKGLDYKKTLATRTVDHIQIADAADLFVILPATANNLAKIAHGIADDFLTTTLLATKASALICPSMNVNMWNNPIVRENISKIKRVGYHVIDPDSGALACDYEGKGRLADLSKIEYAIKEYLHKTEELEGKKILVTAGGTTEPIDDVRFITNRSSGKMGVSLAEACYQRGADVVLLRAKRSVEPRFPIKQETFTTTEELTELLRIHGPTNEICFHSAAVSDFSLPVHKRKISSKQKITLDLIPRKKIIALLKQCNPSIKLIGFKAEWGKSEKEIISIALQKIQKYHLTAMIANDVSKTTQGFDSDNNEVIVILKNGEKKKFPLTSKRQISHQIVDYFVKKSLI